MDYLVGDTFERQVDRSEHYIDQIKDQVKKEWFSNLLFILKEKKYARIKIYRNVPPHHLMEKYGWHKEDFIVTLDIERIAHTWRFASFFDIVAHDDWVYYNAQPEVINKLTYKIWG